jgi:transcriptional regulator NrdR family protein
MENMRVVDTRQRVTHTHRRRECRHCGHRDTTIEILQKDADIYSRFIRDTERSARELMELKRLEGVE